MPCPSLPRRRCRRPPPLCLLCPPCSEAETSGTVVKFVAENGKPVTPGQGLVVIRP